MLNARVKHGFFNELDEISTFGEDNEVDFAIAVTKFEFQSSGDQASMLDHFKITAHQLTTIDLEESTEQKREEIELIDCHDSASFEVYPDKENPS